MAIIGNGDKGDYIYLVGRRDRGIAQASELRHKKLGVAFGTIAQFCLGRYLELNGINPADVSPVDLQRPDDWVSAVVDGEVDAVVTAQPDANTARERLGANGIMLPVQSGQFLNGLIVTTRQWVTAHPDAAVRFLKALTQAEIYAVRNEAVAKKIVQNELSFEDSYMDMAWAQNQFIVSLDQSLITAMEDEARWLISGHMTTENKVPNFIEYVHEAPLKSVKPGAVSVIR